jgi:sigma-E factor negative regulatory protein RseA
MNEELDSQLSAMFDNELPAAECELLARRLSRDEDLKSRWGRYAAIGATIRAEGGVRLNSDLAIRVNTVIAAEPVVVAEPVVQPMGTRPQKATTPRWWMPVGGAALAASVAAAAILFLRYESPQQGGQVASQASPATTSQKLVARSIDATPAAPDSYVVPKTLPRRSIVPSTQLANYVVAHSEFSSPVNRRNLLSAFMATESGTAGAPAGSDEPTEDVSDDAKSPH